MQHPARKFDNLERITRQIGGINMSQIKTN